MLDATSVINGSTYSMAIEEWLHDHDTDPLTNTVLEQRLLIPNFGVRRQAREWLEAHPGYKIEPSRRRAPTTCEQVKDRAEWPTL